MKALIAGITGFVGSHLADFLLTKEDAEVYGIKRWRSRTENIQHLESSIILKECDLRDASSVRRVIEEVKPNLIFHLAGQSHVPTSWHAPEETISTNIMAELNIFEGEAGLMVNPHDAENLAKAVERLLVDSALRKELMEKGFTRTKLLSWEETAQKTLAVYKEVGKKR